MEKERIDNLRFLAVTLVYSIFYYTSEDNNSTLALTSVSEKITYNMYSQNWGQFGLPQSSNKVSLIKWKEWILGYSMNILIF